jgi:glutaredoxin
MVKVYSIPNCPYCVELKDIFIAEGVEFLDVDVNLPENESEYNQLTEITKSDDVPIVAVKNQLLIPNVSFKSIRECYEITAQILREE